MTTVYPDPDQHYKEMIEMTIPEAAESGQLIPMTGRYSGTRVERYLAERYGYAFSYLPVLAGMEDQLWELGRHAMTYRKSVLGELHSTAELIRDITTSIGKDLRPGGIYSPHIPVPDLTALVDELNRLETQLAGFCKTMTATADSLAVLTLQA